VDMEAENERDRMLTDSSSSSETHTPPLKVEGSEEDIPTARPLLKLPPSDPTSTEIQHGCGRHADGVQPQAVFSCTVYS
jgi:hypothetical protein